MQSIPTSMIRTLSFPGQTEFFHVVYSDERVLRKRIRDMNTGTWADVFGNICPADEATILNDLYQHPAELTHNFSGYINVV